MSYVQRQQNPPCRKNVKREPHGNRGSHPPCRWLDSARALVDVCN